MSTIAHYNAVARANAAAVESTSIVSPITGNAVIVPVFERTTVRVQNAGPRKFTAGGAKGDAIVAAIVEGKATRAQIAKAVGCSVSRVGEVVWVMEAAGVIA